MIKVQKSRINGLKKKRDALWVELNSHLEKHHKIYETEEKIRAEIRPIQKELYKLEITQQIERLEKLINNGNFDGNLNLKQQQIHKLETLKNNLKTQSI